MMHFLLHLHSQIFFGFSKVTFVAFAPLAKRVALVSPFDQIERTLEKNKLPMNMMINDDRTA